MLTRLLYFILVLLPVVAIAEEADDQYIVKYVTVGHTDKPVVDVAHVSLDGAKSRCDARMKAGALRCWWERIETVRMGKRAAAQASVKSKARSHPTAEQASDLHVLDLQLEVARANERAAEQQLLAASLIVKKIETEKAAFWSRLAAEYGFDASDPVGIDYKTGEIRALPEKK